MKQTWCRFDYLAAEIDERIVEETAVTGNAFPDFTYEYDKVGNISKLTTLSTAGTDSQTYTYDDLNRLLTASATGGVANYSQTYAYNQIGNLTNFAGTAYAYNDAAHKQAVTHLAGVQKFWYDANGNMTTRIDGSTTYTQAFDVENRLTSVTPSGGSATTFAYDANGIRTKTVQPGGITTYFPFPGYEETVNGANTIKRSSYSFAGQTVAMRVSGDPVSGNNGLFYVLSDHLGSTSMLVNSSGGVVAGSTTRNLPYGGYRGSAPTQTITDRDFTGQKENMELGLLYYQARFYVPGIGRFASADTIVPNPASPQSYNRYSYVLNSPINYSDPSGHNPVCNQGGSVCSDDEGPMLPTPIWTRSFLDEPDWYQYYGKTESAANFYKSKEHSGMDWGKNNTAFGPYDPRLGRIDYTQYGSEQYPLIPVYAGCYCNVISATQLERTDTNHDGKIDYNDDTPSYYPGRVELMHANYSELLLIYGHLINIPELGKTVTPNTVIGYLKAPDPEDGKIRQTDLHVHIEIRTLSNNYINPLPYLHPSLQAQVLVDLGDYSQTTYPGYPSDPYQQPPGSYK